SRQFPAHRPTNGPRRTSHENELFVLPEFSGDGCSHPSGITETSDFLNGLFSHPPFFICHFREGEGDPFDPPFREGATSGHRLAMTDETRQIENEKPWRSQPAERRDLKGRHSHCFQSLPLAWRRSSDRAGMSPVKGEAL